MAKRLAKSVDLSHIIADLRPLALPIAELVPDAANANKHGDKSIKAIKGCLAQFGQRTPLGVQRSGMIVRKGNGTLQAAIELGWTHIACVVADDDDVTAIGYAIADNRSAQLAEWDDEVLKRLFPQIEVGDENCAQMFADMAADLEIIPDVDQLVDGEGGDAAGETVPDRYQVLVTCANEETQKTLLDRLATEGYECRALIV